MSPISAAIVEPGDAEKRLAARRELRVGIIGAGRLGSALAMLTLARGLPRERLLLSTGGGQESLAHLRETGLADRVATNEDIVERCDTVVIALRPQALPMLKPLPYVDGRILVSCMAGIPLRCIAAIAGAGVTRAMTSGPDTLLEGRGIAAVHPVGTPAVEFFAFLGLPVIALADESLMDAFTAAVCLPAALVLVGEAALTDLDELARDYPELEAVFRWAPGVLPPFPGGEAERDAYLLRMITPGGITERIVASMRSGLRMRDAFRKGIDRAREIAAACR